MEAGCLRYANEVRLPSICKWSQAAFDMQMKAAVRLWGPRLQKNSNYYKHNIRSKKTNSLSTQAGSAGFNKHLCVPTADIGAPLVRLDSGQTRSNADTERACHSRPDRVIGSGGVFGVRAEMHVRAAGAAQQDKPNGIAPTPRIFLGHFVWAERPEAERAATQIRNILRTSQPLLPPPQVPIVWSHWVKAGMDEKWFGITGNSFQYGSSMV